MKKKTLKYMIVWGLHKQVAQLKVKPLEPHSDHIFRPWNIIMI